MTHARKILLTILIILLFVVGISTSVYLYMIGFDLKTFLLSLNGNTYVKI